jgi:hypothetical protein
MRMEEHYPAVNKRERALASHQGLFGLGPGSAAG